MNLYDAVATSIKSFEGLKCTHKGSIDVIEKVWFESRGWMCDLKYAGAVNIHQVELIEK